MSKIRESFTHVGRTMALAAGGLVLIISLLSSFEVVMRYFLHSPTSWTYEISRYLLLVMVWIGAAGALQNGSHISVDFVTERLPARIAAIVTTIGYAIALIYMVIVMRETWHFMLKAMENDWETLGNVPIPSSWLYIVIFLGSLFLCVAFIQKMYETITKQESEKIHIEV